MVIPIHAEEKKAAASVTHIKAVAAAIAAFGLPDNVINKTEVVVAEIPADVKAAVEKRLISKIEKAEIDPTATQVFRASIYKVKPILNYFAVIDGEAVDLSHYGTSAILAGYLKLIRDDFVVDSEEKAKLLGAAFQHEYPYKRKEEFKAPVKLDNGWLLIRDEFFKNHSGLFLQQMRRARLPWLSMY